MSSSDLTKPAHPSYGLAEETRQRILADAALMGVTKAAQLHRVSDVAIYNWRKRSSLASTITPAKDASE